MALDWRKWSKGWKNLASQKCEYLTIPYPSQQLYSTVLPIHSFTYSGAKDILYKRLKSHLRLECIAKDPTAPWELQNQCQTNPYNLDYLCVLDFEATCKDPNPPDYIHEIIEFPVVLLNLKTLQVVRTQTFPSVTGERSIVRLVNGCGYRVASFFNVCYNCIHTG